MSQIPIPQSASAEDPKADEMRDDKTRQIAPDVAYRQIAIVNVIFFGSPDAGDGRWILIDAGVTGSASAIRSAAQAIWTERSSICDHFSPTVISTMSARSRRSRPNGTYPSMLINWSIHISTEKLLIRRPNLMSGAA
jgi:hypothetical protein